MRSPTSGGCLSALSEARRHEKEGRQRKAARRAFDKAVRRKRVCGRRSAGAAKELADYPRFELYKLLPGRSEPCLPLLVEKLDQLKAHPKWLPFRTGNPLAFFSASEAGEFVPSDSKPIVATLSQEKNEGDRFVCANVFGLLWSTRLLAMMECAAPFLFKNAVLEDNVRPPEPLYRYLDVGEQ